MILANISPPQKAFLDYVTQEPRHVVSARCATSLRAGYIWCVWSVPVSLQRRGLVRRRKDGRYEPTAKVPR